MNTLPPMKALPVFDAVARYRHFSRAAQSLHVTAGAVSQQIKQLEHYLGCQLLERSNKSVDLTPEGERYWRAIHQALQTIDAATQELKPRHQQVVDIRLLATLAMQWLIPLLPSLQQAHPDIELRIVTTWDQTKWARDDADLAIVYGTALPPDTEGERLWQDSLILVVPQAAQSLPLAKIMARYIAIRVDTPSRQMDWPQWCEANSFTLPEQFTSVSNTVQALQAVRMGVGVVVTHAPFMQLSSANVGLGIAGQAVARDEAYYLVHAAGQRLSRSAQLIKQWVLSVAT